MDIPTLPPLRMPQVYSDEFAPLVNIFTPLVLFKTVYDRMMKPRKERERKGLYSLEAGIYYYQSM